MTSFPDTTQYTFSYQVIQVTQGGSIRDPVEAAVLSIVELSRLFAQRHPLLLPLIQPQIVHYGIRQPPQSLLLRAFRRSRHSAALMWPEATRMDGPEGRCPCLWMLPKEPVGSLLKIEEVARSATPRSPDLSGRPAACGASWARERRGIEHRACQLCWRGRCRGRRGRRRGWGLERGCSAAAVPAGGRGSARTCFAGAVTWG